MEIFENETFEFEGNVYETRVMAIAEGIKVAVFLDGQRANPYFYSVDYTTDMDMKWYRGQRGYEHLMEMAKSDIENKMFEKYVDAVKRIK